MIEAANPEDEALAVAVALREAVHDGKTAALVTPDRALGRRVLAALERWNIAAEDSGGDALADTPAGIFARLAAAAALEGTPPVTLLALLKHPLLRLGPATDTPSPRSSARSCAGRGRVPAAPASPRHSRFSRAAWKFRRHEPVDLHPSDPRIDLTEDELAGAADLVARLGDALAPLESRGGAALPLSELAGRHRDVVAALSRQDGAEIAFAGPDGANSPTRSTNSPRARPPHVCSSRHPTMSNYFPRRFRAASCAGRPGRVCACASSGCSKRA